MWISMQLSKCTAQRAHCMNRRTVDDLQSTYSNELYLCLYGVKSESMNNPHTHLELNKSIDTRKQWRCCGVNQPSCVK